MLAEFPGRRNLLWSLPAVELPPRNFKAAAEHYRYLLDTAHGGTRHTMETVPVWDGPWTSGNNSMPAIFLVDGDLAVAWAPGAEIKQGMLTAPYEAQFRQRRTEMELVETWQEHRIACSGCRRIAASRTASAR
jgi:hypothetical protein